LITELATFLQEAYAKRPIASACCIDEDDILEELTCYRLQAILNPIMNNDFVMYCRKGSMLDKFWRGRKEYIINKDVDFLFRISEEGITYG
jgi:hypothetical protein